MHIGSAAVRRRRSHGQVDAFDGHRVVIEGPIGQPVALRKLLNGSDGVIDAVIVKEKGIVVIRFPLSFKNREDREGFSGILQNVDLAVDLIVLIRGRHRVGIGLSFPVAGHIGHPHLPLGVQRLKRLCRGQTIRGHRNVIGKRIPQCTVIRGLAELSVEIGVLPDFEDRRGRHALKKRRVRALGLGLLQRQPLDGHGECAAPGRIVVQVPGFLLRLDGRDGIDRFFRDILIPPATADVDGGDGPVTTARSE